MALLFDLYIILLAKLYYSDRFTRIFFPISYRKMYNISSPFQRINYLRKIRISKKTNESVALQMELRNRGRSIQRIIHRFFPLFQSLLVKKNESSTSIRMCITPLDPLTIITEIQFSSFLSAVRIENY